MLKPFKLGFKSRVVRWCFVALMAIGIVVPIFSDLTIPSPVYAADCTWTSATSLNCGGTTWNESGITGNNMALTDGNGCNNLNDTITVNNYKTATSAQFVTYTADIHHQCGANGGTFTIGNAYGSTPPPTTSPSAATDPTDCNAGPGFTWLICGMIDVLAKAVDWIRENILVPMLTVPPLTQTFANGIVYKIWASFRNLSSIFFILVFFLVIFGTAIGFDNYTIKKILPRLIAGAILVSFSWYICVIVIDIGNVVAQGLLALASSIIPPPQITLNTGLDVLFVGGLLATAIAGYVIASLGLLFTILIAVVVAFAVLVFRQIAITVLVILSPFALLAWILPNTERFFKLWWTSFIRLILMYPFVMLLFIAGYIFADIAGAGGYGGAGDKFLSPFLALVGLYAPLLLVPLTFSWGGKAMALGSNVINKAGSAANARFGKNSDSAKERHERFQNKKAAQLVDPKFGNAFSRRIAGMQAGTMAAGGFITGRQTSAQKLKQHEKAEKYEHLEGAVKGIHQYETANPQKKLGERVDTQAAATYDKMFAQNQAAALYATKLHGVAARDEYLGGGSKEAEAAVASAKASGDHDAIMAALQHPDAGGLNHLEYHARVAADKGDEVTLAAVASRLVMSGGGSNRMQDIATGHQVMYKDEHGNARFVGGNGMNAVGTGRKDDDGFYHDQYRSNNGKVHDTREAAEADGGLKERIAGYAYWGHEKAGAGALHGAVAAEDKFFERKAAGASSAELAGLGQKVAEARSAARDYQRENGLGSALGGDFKHSTSEQHLDAWNRGASGSKHGDFNKPQWANATDYSASDLAGKHWSEAMRISNIAQNGDFTVDATGKVTAVAADGAAADLSRNIQEMGGSQLLINKTSSDAKRELASLDSVTRLNGEALLSPQQAAGVVNIDKSIHPDKYTAPASTVSPGVTAGVNSVIQSDPVNAGIFHSVIEQERSSNNGSSPTLNRLEQHVTNNNMAAFNQEVASATYAAPAPAGGVQMSKEMYDQILKQTGNNFDETHRLVQAYHRADNDAYRASANDAFYSKKQNIPDPDGLPRPTAGNPPRRNAEEEE